VLQEQGSLSTTVYDFLADCARFPTIRTDSAWTEHTPLALGLSRALGPQRFVELGTHHGQSFLAIAEGMGAMASSFAGEAIAIDTWEGDPQAGHYGEEVYDRFVRRLDHFSEGVGFIRATFDEALSRFSDQSIDLLHIDGFHSYVAVRDDFTAWLPKVAPGGVILFHDVNEFGRDFGAWKLWARLSGEQTITLGNGHGLGLYVHEPLPESWISQLLYWWDEDSANRVFFQDLMMAIGHSFRHEVDRERELRQAHHREILDLQSQLDDVTQQLTLLRNRYRPWLRLK
jgi:O-antigen biosynthesis protein